MRHWIGRSSRWTRWRSSTGVSRSSRTCSRTRPYRTLPRPNSNACWIRSWVTLPSTTSLIIKLPSLFATLIWVCWFFLFTLFFEIFWLLRVSFQISRAMKSICRRWRWSIPPKQENTNRNSTATQPIITIICESNWAEQLMR